MAIKRTQRYEFKMTLDIESISGDDLIDKIERIREDLVNAYSEDARIIDVKFSGRKK